MNKLTLPETWSLAAPSMPRRAFVAGLLVTGFGPRVLPLSAAPASNFVDAVNAFGRELFLRSIGGTDQNVVLSPLSLGLCAALAAIGAEGTTAAEFDAALGVPPGAHASLAEGAKSLGDGIRDLPGLRLANGLALSGNGALVRHDYIARAQNAFDADVMTNATVAGVNAWVARKTGGKIPDLLNTIGDLSLLNAIFFKSEWQNAADRTETESGPFTTAAGKTISVPRMAMRQITCVRRSRCQTFLLPYRDSAAAMIIALPDKGLSVRDLTQALGPRAPREILSAHDLKDGTDVLLLPRFRASFKRDMKAAFESLGLRSIFDATRANFAAMSASQPSPHISSVMHQAVIDVDEAGTTAAAATAATFLAPSPIVRSTVFMIDRPFLFYIVHRGTGSVMMQGSMNDPG